MENNPSFTLGQFDCQNRSQEYKICVVNVNRNHWICCFQYTNSGGQKVWAKIDSLSSNLISNLGQNPDGTNKTPIDIASRYNGQLGYIVAVKSKLNWQD